MSAVSLPTTSRLYGLSPLAIQHVLATARALELGRADEADRHIVGALALYPNHPEILRLLAGIQNLRGEYHQAIATMRAALTQRPDDGLYYNTLGSVLIAASQYDAAIIALHKACELIPNLASAWYNLGIVLMRSIRPQEAAEALRRAISLEPNSSARAMLGDMLKASGHIEEAAAEYRNVIAMHPHAGMAWWGLANLKTSVLSDDDVQKIAQAMQNPQASDDELIAMGFAIAKALDDQSRYAESLDMLARANTRARQRHNWNAATHSRVIDSILKTFTPPLTPASEPLGEEVIFITSLPRSGSTLIEQILASHSLVEGAGELSDLPLVLTEESQRRGQSFPQWVHAMRPDDWARLGRRYLERTAHWRKNRPRFTDKLPNNWFYAGAIRAMLPSARIIICRRDPLETCLSCYRQHFAGNEYAKTFTDLALYWRDFDRAAMHWQTLHPMRIYQSVYEELVAEPEIRIRKLLAFCGLDFEASCLEFHKTERHVYTPSAAQVREPLRNDTARAKRYGVLLNPLRAALGYSPFKA